MTQPSSKPRSLCLTTSLPLTLALSACATQTPSMGVRAAKADADPGPVYPTYGVHNSPSESPCTAPNCVYTRKPGEPSDPSYPAYWTSHWTMYRVFSDDFAKYPPPYDGRPPKELQEGRDYEVSYGVTYYDSTWVAPTHTGAMMEHYDKRCLPIFPIDNRFTCSFVSVGQNAFFLTYEQDRPKGMPPVCLFSPRNHAPLPDFISHLPYSAGDSERLGGRVQGYSFWTDPEKGPQQVGVSPDGTNKNWIMFGYGFESEARPDAVDKAAAPYRHPQSFYFSGVPTFQRKLFAPIVSQNYTDFAMVRPDPEKTWKLVSGLDPKTLPACQLFQPPASETLGIASERPKHPTWGDLQRSRR